MILSWLPPFFFTLFIYFTLPLAPKLWAYLNGRFDTRTLEYFLLALLGLLVSVTAVYVVLRLKTRRWERTAWLVSLGLIYTWYLGTIPHVIEQVHLVEYGILAGLVFFALRRSIQGKALYLTAWTITFILGVFDEWIQFALPVRVGSVPDINLNGVSAGLALLWVGMVFGPGGGAEHDPARGVRVLCGTAVFLLLLLGVFITSVTEFGYRHTGPAIGTFYSHFTLEELRNKDRLEGKRYAAAVKDLYPVKMHSYLKHQTALDKFKMEALVHLFRRDRYVQKQNYWVAYKENRILMSYFPNTLRGSGYAWSSATLRRIEGKMKFPAEQYYESPVSRDDVIVSFGPGILWGGIAAGVSGFFLLAVWGSRSSRLTEILAC